jgi:hypothetical protein
MMTIGILVTTDRHRDDIIGITEAAIRRGHRVIIFFMDKGCWLIKDAEITGLCSSGSVSMSICDLNRRQIGIADVDVPAGIVCGSQYDNAVMNRESDKVIVF